MGLFLALYIRFTLPPPLTTVNVLETDSGKSFFHLAVIRGEKYCIEIWGMHKCNVDAFHYRPKSLVCILIDSLLFFFVLFFFPHDDCFNPMKNEATIFRGSSFSWRAR